ncbi:hypothetical protein CAOG_04063 [Capsaspora owczarzaki ATCC 30864]|nr:hypothetical protein CAOG_04063 [Capsaspora owczarzaki ATCC 30864]|eukprot:XP_004347888.1 hypothetical protein CAOG_04063 [Capsaspora owczarzaki ATCC 30864]
MFLSRPALGGLVWFGKHAKSRKMTATRKDTARDSLKLVAQNTFVLSRPFITANQELRGFRDIDPESLTTQERERLQKYLQPKYESKKLIVPKSSAPTMARQARRMLGYTPPRPAYTTPVDQAKPAKSSAAAAAKLATAPIPRSAAAAAALSTISAFRPKP